MYRKQNTEAHRVAVRYLADRGNNDAEQLRAAKIVSPKLGKMTIRAENKKLKLLFFFGNTERFEKWKRHHFVADYVITGLPSELS